VCAPDFQRLAQEPDGPFVPGRELKLPTGHHLIRRDRFVSNDIIGQLQHYELRFEEHKASGELMRKRTEAMNTRYTFRCELQLLLEREGLKVVAIYSDYDESSCDGKGEIIMVSRRPE
jgi:hypothetical protein